MTETPSWVIGMTTAVSLVSTVSAMALAWVALAIQARSRREERSATFAATQSQRVWDRVALIYEDAITLVPKLPNLPDEDLDSFEDLERYRTEFGSHLQAMHAIGGRLEVWAPDELRYLWRSYIELADSHRYDLLFFGMRDGVTIRQQRKISDAFGRDKAEPSGYRYSITWYRSKRSWLLLANAGTYLTQAIRLAVGSSFWGHLEVLRDVYDDLEQNSRILVQRVRASLADADLSSMLFGISVELAGQVNPVMAGALRTFGSPKKLSDSCDAFLSAISKADHEITRMTGYGRSEVSFSIPDRDALSAILEPVLSAGDVLLKEVKTAKAAIKSEVDRVSESNRESD